jgi:threonine/homoserine/homoserine lactone efflux protein
LIVSPLFAFLVAAFVLAITPGPGIAYVVARTVAGGRKEGLASCLGTAIGGLVHVLATALGLSVIIAQSAFAFGLVKVFGSAYLIYLGIKMLLQKDQELAPTQVEAQGSRRAFAEGVLVETLNVKTAVFFVAFLPQFIKASEPAVAQLVGLGTICVALNTAVDVAAVFAADRLLQAREARKQRALLLRRTSGFTMLLLGAYMAMAKREP